MDIKVDGHQKYVVGEDVNLKIEVQINSGRHLLIWGENKYFFIQQAIS